MGGCVQLAAVVLIPQSAAPGLDHRQGPFAVAAHHNGTVRGSLGTQMECLSPEHRAPLQADLITGGQHPLPDGGQAAQSFLRAGAGVVVAAGFVADVVNRLFCHLPVPVSLFALGAFAPPGRPPFCKLCGAAFLSMNQAYHMEICMKICYIDIGVRYLAGTVRQGVFVNILSFLL